MQSRLEQWYYDEILPWVHYVPVSSDLSDVDAAVAFVLDGGDAARRIAEAATKFAREAPSLNYVAMAGRVRAYLLGVWA